MPRDSERPSGAQGAPGGAAGRAAVQLEGAREQRVSACFHEPTPNSAPPSTALPSPNLLDRARRARNGPQRRECAATKPAKSDLRAPAPRDSRLPSAAQRAPAAHQDERSYSQYELTSTQGSVRTWSEAVAAPSTWRTMNPISSAQGASAPGSPVAAADIRSTVTRKYAVSWASTSVGGESEQREGAPP